MSPLFIDTTLRDGVQEADISFNHEEREKILEKLEESGIRYYEAGIAASGNGVCKPSSGHMIPLCWARAIDSDIEAALAQNTGAVHISYPVSFLLMSKVGWQAHQVLDIMIDQVRRYAGETDFFSIGAMDAFQADRAFLKQFTCSAVDLGVVNVRLADTRGLAAPDDVEAVFTDLSSIRRHLEFHGHNDLGLATANAYTAVIKGAGAVSGTLSGIGERAGNTPLEELVLALYLKHGEAFTSGMNLRVLTEAAHLVHSFTGQTVSPRKPLMGEHVFCQESGIHVNGMIKDPLSYQPFPPELIGRQVDFRLGTSSSVSSVRLALKTAGLSVEDHLHTEILGRIKITSAREKQSYPLEDIRKFI